MSPLEIVKQIADEWKKMKDNEPDRLKFFQDLAVKEEEKYFNELTALKEADFPMTEKKEIYDKMVGLLKRKSARSSRVMSKALTSAEKPIKIK
jgi:hypothetical protein